MSQTRDILNMLKSNPNGITPRDALDWAGCFRLAARIADLRAQGYEIETVIEKGSKHARYRLVAS